MSVPDRRALLDPDHDQLSVRRQCALLGMWRSGFIGIGGRRTTLICR